MTARLQIINAYLKYRKENGKTPELITVSQELWEQYQEELTPDKRFADPTLKRENIMESFYSVPVVWEEDCASIRCE